MAVTNLYSNLPGHLVEFKDGGLQLTVENNDTSNKKSLLILGTAFDGPVNEPVKIDETTVSQLFGSEVNEKGYANGATLTKYAKQAFKNGFKDVRCMRVTGSQAYVDINKTAKTIEHIEYGTASGITEGCDEFEFTLTSVPVISANAVTLSKNEPVTTNGFNELTGRIKFGKNAISKGETIKVDYTYKDISSAPVTSTENVSDNGIDFKDIPLANVNVSSGVFLFNNTVVGTTIPVTSSTGVTVKFNGSIGPDTDYSVDVTNYTVKIKDGNVTNITASDTVDIEYYTYTIQPGSDSYTDTSSEQVVTLEHEPKDGIIELIINGATVDSSNYIVSGADVRLTAGKFYVNDTFNIKYEYIVTEQIIEGITIRSIYGGSVYKEASVKIEPFTTDAGDQECNFIFTKPTAKLYSKADKPFLISSVDCPTVGALKTALANYELNNVFEIVTDSEDITTSNFPAFESALINGGDDGVVITNNQLFEALSGKRNAEGYLIEQGAYQILENYHVDYIYPAGVYADAQQTVNKNSSFHQELALLCAVLTYRTKMTHGFIDVKPNANTTLVGIQKYVDKLLAYDNYHYMKDSDGNEIVDTDGNKMDIGWYTSIVVGPEPVMISDTLGTWYGSPAIAYAALNATLKPESSPMNKALPGVKGMKYKFSNKQMDALTGNRMVVFKLKGEGTTTASSTPYVVDGCTAGNENCDYRRIATVKVVTDVIDQVREVSDPFLGEPNTVEQRNALSALISKRLSYLLSQGEIQYYEFEINATIQQVLLGECTISLTLVVPQELRKITTVVALRATA